MLPSAEYEPDANRDHRALCQDRAQRHIFWRSVNYFLMVSTTLALFLMPFYQYPVRNFKSEGLRSIVEQIFSAVAPVLPNFLTKWTQAWTQSPFWFITLTVLLTGLTLYARSVTQFIHLLAEVGWRPIKSPRGEPPVLPEKGFFERLADQIFDHPLTMRFLGLVNRSLMWVILALAILLLI